MDKTNNHINSSETEHKVLKDVVEYVQVKTEIVSEDDLPVNVDKTPCKINAENQFINNINSVEVKKEIIDYDLENSISDLTFRQGCSTQIKSEYNEETFNYEDYNKSDVPDLSTKINDYGELDGEAKNREDEMLFTLHQQEISQDDSIHKQNDKRKNCQFCNKSFSAKHSLDDHLLKQHINEIEHDIERFISYKIHPCNDCSYTTTRTCLLNKHISRHHKEKKTKTCEFCNRSFSRKQSIENHMLTHHKTEIKGDLKDIITSKIHKCKICNAYETTNKTNYDRHINSVHNEEKIKFKCQFCTDSFLLRRSLDGHLLRKHKENIKGDIDAFIISKIYSCKICPFVSTVNSVLANHLNSIHNKKVKFKCDFCNEIFPFKHTLDNHLKNHHEAEFNENEEEVPFVGTYVAELSKEINDHGEVEIDIKEMNCLPNENKYTLENENSDDQGAFTPDDGPLKQGNERAKMKDCQFCNKSFTAKHSLDDHLLKQHRNIIENDIKQFITYKIHTCKICSYATTRTCLLNKHLSKHHKQKMNTKTCEFCTKSFSKKQSLEDHMLKKHKDEVKGDVRILITSKIHMCNECPYETINKDNLDRHINSVHNEFKIKMKCHFCTDSFLLKRSLDAHLLRNHKDKIKHDIKAYISSNIYSCKICSFVATVRNVYNKHVNSIHNKKTKFKCHFCDELFPFKYSLDNHMLTQHESKLKGKIKKFISSKIHKCMVCNSYQSRNIANLTRHMLNCNVSDKSVKAKKLKRKEKIKKEIYICDICAYRTRRKHRLIYHFNSVHNRGNNIKDSMTQITHNCKICAYETTNTNLLNSHIVSNHNNVSMMIERTIICCHICYEVFSTNKLLDDHLLNEHNMEIKIETKDSVSG